jgi:hypothetical protein
VKRPGRGPRSAPSLLHSETRSQKRLRVVTTVVLTAVGVALVAAALAANQRWLDRHFLPSFFLPRRQYIQIQWIVRLAFATVGVSVALIAPFAARLLTARILRLAFSMVVAAVLALAAGEFFLHYWGIGPAEWLLPEDEPRRQPDPGLGWTLVPARIGYRTIDGREVEYAIDSAGYRVRGLNEPVDPDQPVILFAGESMMFGEGLNWDESVPAQVGAMMQIQSANLAVHGFSTDQAYLRLQQELPRFRRPVAVVTLFMTALFGRNLDDDRPHLGPGLLWRPAVEHTRLKALATVIVPYRSIRTVERGLLVTRETLRATVDLARRRGALPLIVVPQFGREDELEQTLRRRILDETGLPYTFVEINEAWRLPWNQHPDDRASRLIAKAIASWLQARLARDFELRVTTGK